MSSKEATFTELAKEFQLAEEVKKLFMDSHMASLEDFRYYFADEKEIDAFCATDDKLKDAALRIQV